MRQKECIAMILAGGRGERLGSLTHYYAKPAVFFGGNYRIIDFTLSNCVNSGIDTIGILSQYFADDLHMYISSVELPKKDAGRLHMRPSRRDDGLYSGTADAVYQNIDFIDGLNPTHVLVLSGDHIYRMDYRKMLDFHEKSGADVTIASTPVPRSETSKYGILSIDEFHMIHDFVEKPWFSDSALASMGVYIFKWGTLRKHLMLDKFDAASRHDFGQNIIPNMLNAGERLYTYRFDGYWRDVGTVDSLWQSNMDILQDSPLSGPTDTDWKIYSAEIDIDASYVSRKSLEDKCMISGNCMVKGSVLRTVVSRSVVIREGAEISNCVIMPHAYIGKNVKINKAVIGPYTKIMDSVEIGLDEGSDLLVDHRICAGDVSLVAPWLRINEGLKFRSGSHIDGGGLRDSFTGIEPSEMEKHVPISKPSSRKILAR